MDNALHPHRHSYRVLIIALFLALAVITIAVIFQYQRMGLIQDPQAVSTRISSQLPVPSRIVSTTQDNVQVLNKTTVSTTPIAIQTSSAESLFTLKTSQEKSTYQKGEEIVIQVIGNSAKKPVLGYDVIVGANQDAYELISVKSVRSEFTVIKFVKDDHLTVTGILKPSITEEVAFSGEPILEIVLKSKISGSFNLQVLAQSGSESSKFVTSGSGGALLKEPASDSAALSLDIK